MLLSKRFQSFMNSSLVSVAVRGVLERAFDPARLDALFEKAAQAVSGNGCSRPSRA